MGEMNKGYYAIIPANIRYDNEIPPTAKLLYSEITALCNVKGYCWPGNEYFAELYNVSERTIYRWISKLVKKGYIVIEYQYKAGTKEILKRYIKLACKSEPVYEDNSDLGSDKNVSTSCQKCQYPGSDKNVSTGGDKNVRDNNIIYNNNIINNNSHFDEKPKEPDEGQPLTKDIYETIMNLYSRCCTNLPKVIKLTDNRKKIIKKLVEIYTLEQIKAAFININNSDFCSGNNDRGWKADFDFCINSNKVTNALEGKYQNNFVNKPKQQKPNKFHNFNQKIAAMGESKLEEIVKKKWG